ncbi:MAG: NADP-dependent oxidoreductase [Bacillus thermozeamaize]|uniref:NADP-dependent oxidoreductase n=1 Tax=Bacillus thermozeamaize TaxID=230954 RepID=A0A1Y3Q0A0_9BACI|nr:MAG: NADP-dependent oxidoreductase [Bacillus thermozeamaize]
MNQQIILVSRPKGMPTDENFAIVETPIPQPKEGEVLIQTLYLSVDPYMRGRMSDRKSYVPPYELNGVVGGGAVGRVLQSKSPSYREGDIVLGNYGWQRYAVASADQLQKVNPELAPITTALGVLGMPGLTAYFGLLDIGQPKEGETVVVSGAAGAVGMTVGQIAKIKGCRVVGIAGSDEKTAYLVQELGFDAAINYKTATDLREDLKAACPNGVDIYFDNVGGTISDAVMTMLNYQARIPLCGQIALYNLEKPDVGPRMQTQLLITSSLMKGFIVRDYASRFEEGISQLAQWVREGRLKYKENIVEGFENTIKAFLGLFTGENLGKQLVKVAD